MNTSCFTAPFVQGKRERRSQAKTSLSSLSSGGTLKPTMLSNLPLAVTRYVNLLMSGNIRGFTVCCDDVFNGSNWRVLDSSCACHNSMFL